MLPRFFSNSYSSSAENSRLLRFVLRRLVHRRLEYSQAGPLVSYDYDRVYIYRHEGVQRTAFPGHLVCILSCLRHLRRLQTKGCAENTASSIQRPDPPEHDPGRSCQNDQKNNLKIVFSLSLFPSS